MRRFHLDCLHERKVDYQSIIADGCAGNIVPAAAYGGENLVLTGKTHGAHNVRIISTKRDQSGPAVNPSIPNSSRSVVAVVAPANKLPSQLLFESLYLSDGNISRHLRPLVEETAAPVSQCA